MLQCDHTHIDEEILIACVLLWQERILLLMESHLSSHQCQLLLLPKILLIVIFIGTLIINIGVDEEGAMRIDAVIVLIAF